MTAELTKQDALKLVQPFFPNEWSKVTSDQVELSAISGGMIGQIWKISRQRNTTSEKTDQEPISLIIRRQGGNVLNFDTQDIILNSLTGLTLIAYEMGVRGIGPKVYGSIENGMIEEYLGARTLTNDDTFDPDIGKDIAIAIARAHAIKGLPLSKIAGDNHVSRWRASVKMVSDKMKLIANHESVKKFNLDEQRLISFDFVKHLDWFNSVRDRIKMRKNFILDDRHHLNCMIRDQGSDNSGRDANEDEKLRVALIDYDMARYDYRGIDLGAHIIHRRLNHQSDSEQVIRRLGLPTRKEITAFISDYQSEIKRLNTWEDFDDMGIDSLDNLYIECYYGICHRALLAIFTICAQAEIILENKPAMITLVDFFALHLSDWEKEIESLIKRTYE